MPGADCMYNVVIIGSGCAGLTAAIYAARANLNPLVLDGHEPGGQLSLTTHVENFPGFPEGILGPELIEKMREQAKKFGTEFRSGTVTEVDLTRRPFRISAAKDIYEAETLIVASGASARLLGLKGERELIGRGLSTCATCDGYFFRGKAIAVVGGGDTAMEEANFLSRYASHVYLIHRRDEFRASKIMIDRAKANEKVEFLIPYVVDEILTNDNLVNGVRIRNTTTGETRDLELHGVFVAIGHDPNSMIFRGKVDMDQNGYLVSHNGTTTNVPGVFIAGDVQDPRYKQAVTAAASGCMAALDAEKFLEEHKNLVATGLSR
jgi:thioredoxin reductase (NADPH)